MASSPVINCHDPVFEYTRSQPFLDEADDALVTDPMFEEARSAPAFSKSAAQSDTKHARILAMLRTPAGATIAAIMIVTEWQPHSVRGFLAGVVRKKLGLNLISEVTDKGRVYRIKDGKGLSAAAVDQAA